MEPDTSLRHRAAATWLVALACGFAPLAAHATGYLMFPSLGVSDKPQSKLWYNDGSWWAAMNATDRIGIYELSGSTWTARDSVGAPAPPRDMGGTTDALWDGSNLYIAAFDSVTSRLYKYTYDTPTRDYLPDPAFPVFIPMGIGAETLTLAKDTTGRLWCTYETDPGPLSATGTGRIEVRYTTASDADWSAAPDSIGGLTFWDDISATVAFNGKIGVLWSNQNDYAFYFRWRNDTDPPNVWSATETVIEGVQIADDHINLTVDASGRVFAALKDQFNRIIVSRRNLDGTWTSRVDVTYGRAATRPVILVDDSQSKLYCFYTRWPAGGHIGINYIEYRVADANALVFGLETIFIDSPTVSMNNVTSTKQGLSPGSLLALCDGDDGRAYWNGWGPISGIGGTGGGGPLPAAPNPPGQPVATTAVAPGGSLGVAAYTLEEGAGSTSADQSGRGHTLMLGSDLVGDNAEPEWSSGITGSALYFNGINDYARIADPGDLSFAGSFTVECWVRPLDEPAAMTLLSKGATTMRNYRLELTSGGGAEISVKNTAGTTFAATSSNAFLFDNGWHHLAGVYDATALQLRLYVDGTLLATKPVTGTITTSSEAVYVGVRQSTSGLGRYVYGILDQIRLSSSAVYADNFAPPFAFTTRPTKYVKLTWGIPTAQGGISGYNVFRSLNGSPFSLLNGTLLVSTNAYNDATAVDGFLTYRVTAVDLLGQESLGSPTLSMEFEGYDPLPPAIPQAYAVNRHVATGGLVAGYPLDEGSGQSVVDVAGNGYSGSLGASSATETQDPVWRPGISGSSLEFDGSNDYATIPDAAGLQIPGSFTIETWFKLNQTGLVGCLLGKGSSSQRNYRLTMLSSGKLELSFDTTTGSTRKVTSGAAVTDLAWHHASGVYDTDAGQLRIYLDGVLSASASTTGTPRTGTDPLYLGTRKSSSSLKDFFKGRVDLVEIYSAAVRTDDFTPPTGLVSTTGGGYVTLHWALPEQGLVRGYNIYRTLPGQMDWRLNRTALVAETQYTDDGPHLGSNCYFVRAVNAHGVEGTPTQTVCVVFAAGEAPTDAGGPSARRLGLRVAPNPFNPSTRISFHLDHPGDADLVLFDVSGRRARTWRLRGLPAGDQTLPLHVEDASHRLASGIYFLQLESEGKRERTRVVVLK